MLVKIMAIIPGEQKSGLLFLDANRKKQNKLIYVLGGVLLATAGVYFLYLSNFSFLPESESSQTISSPGNELTSRIVEILKPVSLNFSLSGDKKFQNLILFGVFPIVVGEKGRPDPFAPF